MPRKAPIKMNGQQRRKLGNWLEENWDRIQEQRIFKPEAARQASKDLGFEVTICWLQTVTNDIDKKKWLEPKGDFDPLPKTSVIALLCEVMADVCQCLKDQDIFIPQAETLRKHAKALRKCR